VKTVRRLLYRDIVASVLFVAGAFLSLFFFIDFVDQLERVGRGGYTLGRALRFSLFELPGHFYEFFPIAVLIGAIYSLARLAQSSEFTILRTGGLGPGRALGLLTVLGLAFALVTFVVGDYVAPVSERLAVQVKEASRGSSLLGRSGAWLKERRIGADGEHSFSVHVAGTAAQGQLSGVRVFEFNADGRLVERLSARTASVGDDGYWRLLDVERTIWPAAGSTDGVRTEQLASYEWPSTLASDTVAAAVLPLSTMSTVELWRYTSHLAANEQAAQRHEIQFWKRALYPFACLVMVALALPFAYLHARAGGVSLRVFGGILLGISFVLLNNVAHHLGMLRDWTPWVTAAMPSVVYLLLSLAAFGWLVRYR
jgi:lipopolysaccharide export system permease protein